MSGSKSGQFFIGSIVIFLVIFGLILALLNSMNDLGKHATTPEKMDEASIAERIKPIAEVNIGEPPAVQAPAPEEAPSESDAVATLVSQVCAACHGAGLMGSPKIGNAKDWAPRIDKGIDTLYNHAINGFNAMPAKGGRADLSDDQIKAAVDYMVAQAK